MSTHSRVTRGPGLTSSCQCGALSCRGGQAKATRIPDQNPPSVPETLCAPAICGPAAYKSFIPCTKESCESFHFSVLVTYQMFWFQIFKRARDDKSVVSRACCNKTQNQEICHAFTGQCSHFFGLLRLVLTCDCLRSRWSCICCAVAAKLLILLEEPGELLFEFQ